MKTNTIWSKVLLGGLLLPLSPMRAADASEDVHARPVELAAQPSCYEPLYAGSWNSRGTRAMTKVRHEEDVDAEVAEGGRWRSPSFGASFSVAVDLEFRWKTYGQATTVTVTLIDDDTGKPVALDVGDPWNPKTVTFLTSAIGGAVSAKFEDIHPDHTFHVEVTLGNPGGSGILGICGQIKYIDS
jgi:hypothetical protein